jgi:hypothetical protein
MRVLVIDVGGTHVKALATGHKKPVEIPSGPKMTAAEMVTAMRTATVTWIVQLLRVAMQADYVVLGGGNARLLTTLPPRARLGQNAHAFEGGYPSMDKAVQRINS